jgi:oligopeptide transport system ATP-binding protein
MSAPLLEVESLAKHYRVAAASLLGPPRRIKAVDGVSFKIAENETLGLVGESGSGKSTVGRVILRLVPQTSGSVRFRGQDIFALSLRAFKPLRRDMQMVFQDPMASLNPRYTVAQLIEEPMLVHDRGLDARARRAKAMALLEQVGLDGTAAKRFPHEFSGGQRQRIGIARAIAVNARLIIADEPVSALDVSVQAQVLNLLRDLKDRYGLSYLFIAHDLAVVKHMSQRIAVMYLGRIVESAPAREIYARPAHPYTQMLLESVPRPRVDTSRRSDPSTSRGEIPSLIDPPKGCAFHTRCKFKTALCEQVAPTYREIAPGHFAACHLV